MIGEGSLRSTRSQDHSLRARTESKSVHLLHDDNVSQPAGISRVEKNNVHRCRQNSLLKSAKSLHRALLQKAAMPSARHKS